MQYLISLFVSLVLMSSSAIAGSKLVSSQCEMLGFLTGEMTAREIKGEKYEKYILELFPRFDRFPDDVQVLILTIPRVIKKDRVVYPDTAGVPAAHEDAMVNFCRAAKGDVETMQKGLEAFINGA